MEPGMESKSAARPGEMLHYFTRIYETHIKIIMAFITPLKTPTMCPANQKMLIYGSTERRAVLTWQTLGRHEG
jgi:hypothetical protein